MTDQLTQCVHCSKCQHPMTDAGDVYVCDNQSCGHNHACSEFRCDVWGHEQAEAMAHAQIARRCAHTSCHNEACDDCGMTFN